MPSPRTWDDYPRPMEKGEGGLVTDGSSQSETPINHGRHAPAMGYVVEWWLAVSNQAERVCGALRPGIQLAGTSKIDAMLLAFALDNLRRAVQLVAKVVPDAEAELVTQGLSRFDSEVPAVREIRNVLAHFDDYVQGKGHLQQKVEGGWLGIRHSDTSDGFVLALKFSPDRPASVLDVVAAKEAAHGLFRSTGRAVDRLPLAPTPLAAGPPG